jgi:hypothetical protein
MLRLHNDRLSLWEAVLAPELLEMNEEPAKVDKTPGSRFQMPNQAQNPNEKKK